MGGTKCFDNVVIPLQEGMAYSRWAKCIYQQAKEYAYVLPLPNVPNAYEMFKGINFFMLSKNISRERRWKAGKLHLVNVNAGVKWRTSISLM